MDVAKPYVFLSHSSKDNRFVSRLADDLREAGFNVWVDLDSIPAGSRWLRAIQDGVEGCNALIVVMSRAARESEWVERETLVALQRQIPLLIAQVEDVPLPLHLVDRQYTDFTHDYDEPLAELIDALHAASPGTEPPPDDITPQANEDNFFKYLDQMPQGEHMAWLARDLYKWAGKHADSVQFGGKHTPGMHVQLHLGDETITVFSVWAYMRNPALQIPFDQLDSYRPYNDRDMRLSTLRSLNLLMPDGEQFEDERADRRPTLPLTTALDTADKLERLKDILHELMDNLRAGY